MHLCSCPGLCLFLLYLCGCLSVCVCSVLASVPNWRQKITKSVEPKQLHKVCCPASMHSAGQSPNRCTHIGLSQNGYGKFVSVLRCTSLGNARIDVAVRDLYFTVQLPRFPPRPHHLIPPHPTPPHHTSPHHTTLHHTTLVLDIPG